MSDTWWYAQGTQRLGPVPRATLQSLVDAGVVSRDTLVWAEGMGEWQAAHEVPAWAACFAAPPPLPAQPPPLPTSPTAVLPPPTLVPAPIPAPVPATPPAPQVPGPSASPLPPATTTGPWAPYPRRLAAGLIDLVLVTLVAVVLPGLAWPNAALWIDSDSISGAPIVLGLLASLGYVAYHAVMLSLPGEATWGKRLMGLRVTDEAGARLSFWRALGRAGSQIYSALPLGIGLLMPLWTRRHQALHDKLARTLAVRATPAQWPPGPTRGPRPNAWQGAALWLALPLTLAPDLYDAGVWAHTQQTARRLHQEASVAADKVTQEFEATGWVAGRALGSERADPARSVIEVEAETGIVNALDPATAMRVTLVPSRLRDGLQWHCTYTYHRSFSSADHCDQRITP